MNNFDAMKKFISAMSGQENMISVPKIYIQLFDGDIDTALFLSQVVYWSDKSKRTDGFFYKKYDEWELEIGLSEYKIKKAVKKLKAHGIVITSLKRANGAPTIHYKLDMTNLQNLIMKFLDNQKTSESDSEIFIDSESEVSSESLTETTTEITQENTVVLKQPGKIFRIYEQEIGALSPMISDDLLDIEKEYSDGWFEKAIKAAHQSTSRITLGYIKAILKRWKAEGVDFVEQSDDTKKKKNYKLVIDENGNTVAKEIKDES